MDPGVKNIYKVLYSSSDYVNTILKMPPVVDKLCYAAEILEDLKSRAYTNMFLSNQWCLYILEVASGSYYTGITNNLENRLRTHREGRGSKYVRAHLPFRVVYIELMEDRSQASKLEYKIKQLSKHEKHKYRIALKPNTLALDCTCGLIMKLSKDMAKNITCALSCPSCGTLIADMEDQDNVVELLK